LPGPNIPGMPLNTSAWSPPKKTSAPSCGWLLWSSEPALPTML
jgi:hypothetical protein